MAPNEVSANFCANCRAPLSSYASTGPVEHLFAEGAVYRQAAERPRKFVVVLGVWLLFGMMLLVGLWRCIFGSSQDEPLVPRIIVSLFGLAVVAVSGAMIWKTTRNYLALSRRA
jgi:di/tricarboxylate transporter